jgi:hypothetical protein
LINADKPTRWKRDVAESVALYNEWFFRAAPKAYRDTRASTIEQVRDTFLATDNLRGLGPDVLRRAPSSISALRMMTAPPLARDRLIGLGGLSSPNLLKKLEEGVLPPLSLQTGCADR